MNRERLLARFLRYVQVHTTAVEDSGTYPSSPGQLVLGKMLADELLEIGLSDVEHDEHGLVWATVPSTVDRPVPVVALNSHLDTSAETTGENVSPQVIREYAGGDIRLSGDSSKIITTAINPELNELHGCTLITTDGTTLLGGDDKAGVAVIVELANHLVENPQIPHGNLRILFTCDEEIGFGVDHVDLEKLGATVCYTLDGGGANELDVETFSADMAIVTVNGVNTHPGTAKDRMVNAIRAAGDFIARLPREMSPERTDDRDGFMHPYVIEGGVAQVTLKILLRDFEASMLEAQAGVLQSTAEGIEVDHPGVDISINVHPQYRNMMAGLDKEPRAVRFADLAHRRLGREAKRTIVRGGTDGSRLTELGLPTPNLSTGQHNLHSPLEWACLDEMVQAAEVLVELVQIWAEETAG